MCKVKLICLILVCLGMAVCLTAQTLPDYTFAQQISQYSEVTGGMLLGNETTDEQKFVDPFTPLGGNVATGAGLPIGFTFTFNQYAFDRIGINANGWMTFGQSAVSPAVNMTTSFAYTPLSNNAPINPSQLMNRVAVLANDLIAQAGSTLRVETIGTVPNRICVIQWKNYRRYGTWGVGGSYNFQIRLEETTNKVVLAYGQFAQPASDVGFQVGLRGALETDFTNRSTSLDWNATIAGTTNEATCVINNVILPPNGLKFIYMPPLTGANDLKAVSLSGSATPASGAMSIYHVQVKNLGSAQQINYLVKLMSGTTELASVNGYAVDHLATVDVQIPWYPSAVGAMVIYGKVVLANDQNDLNDRTPDFNIVVQPVETVTIAIGTGVSTDNVPVDMSSMNSLFETIYPSYETNFSGLITGIAFYNDFVTNLPDKPTKIWLGTTNLLDLGAGWIPSTQLAAVFDGNVTYPSGVNLIYIPLQNPFVYNGGNLVMMVNRPMDTDNYSMGNVFYTQTSSVYRSRMIDSWSSAINPDAPPTTGGSLYGVYPKTSLFVIPSSIAPHCAITPNSCNFGQQLINTIANQQFTVTNTGGGTLTVNSIALSGSPYFTLSNLPALPLALTGGQIAMFTVSYNPAEAGSHSATLTIADDQMRIQQSVQITGDGIDLNIYQLPYTQNFDNVAVPNLPDNWFRIVQTSATNCYVKTVTSSPYSSPNCAAMYNYTDASAQLFLVSPPIAPTFPITTLRLRFRAKGSTPYILKVGILSNPNSPGTFEEIESVALTTSWVEYTVTFQNYTGQGHCIAFKHGTTGISQTIYLDNFAVDEILENDLAVMSITGNQNPTAGQPSAYTVAVTNAGLNAQTGYVVELFDHFNQEIAVATGQPLSFGQTANISLNWIPAMAEVTYIYARVLLTGDENTQNDQSQFFNVNIQPLGTFSFTIGDGSQTARLPVDMYYMNSLFETIFPASEITTEGMIYGIAFYNNFVTYLPEMPTKIWLGVTEQTNLSAGWIPSTQLMAVFDGTVSYPSGQNSIYILLQAPFLYSGGNLVMMVNRPPDTTYYSSDDKFYCQTIGTNRSRNVYRDTPVINPEAPPTAGAFVSGQFPKTTFFTFLTTTNPQFDILPQSYDFGQILQNTSSSKTFYIRNTGGGTLTISNIAITGNPFFSLSSFPTLPFSLNVGQSIPFDVSYHPTAAGTQTATITITDDLGRVHSYAMTQASGNRLTRTQHQVPLSGTAIDPTIVTLPSLQYFDGVTAPDLPLGWSANVQSTTATAYIKTTSASSHSAPNCISMFNAIDTAAQILLISPPLSDALPVSNLRVKFYAMCSATSTLKLGILTDPANSDSFVAADTVALTTAWAEYIVDFTGYSGQGHYIGFKYGSFYNYQNIYLDDIQVVTVPQNDMAALSIRGELLPVAGQSLVYTVALHNWGLTPSTDYTLKLYSSDNIELASSSGPPLMYGQTADVSIRWIPTVMGVMDIYAKVVLAGDSTSYNDQTGTLALDVQPETTEIIQVGAGDQLAEIPVDLSCRYSLYETLYYPEEINRNGIINYVIYYNNFPNWDFPDSHVQIWMGTTTLHDLEGGWIPSTQLLPVFDGYVDFPQGQNVIAILLTTPFLYAGQNLVVMTRNPHMSTWPNAPLDFLCQTLGTNRARNFRSDSTNPNPASPPATGATVTGQFPKTKFLIDTNFQIGSLVGTVVNESGQPVRRATVQLDTGYSSITSDEAGTFSFQAVPIGTHNIVVHKPGYVDLEQVFTITQNLQTQLNLVLQHVPLVTVTGRLVQYAYHDSVVANASIVVNGASDYIANSNSQGYFTFSAIPTDGIYTYTVTHPRFIALNGDFSLDYFNYSLDTLFVKLRYVGVAGKVVHAAGGTIGISGASVTLTGADTLSMTTDASGYFYFSRVLTNSSYAILVTHEGYISYTGSCTVGYTPAFAGNLPLTELIYPPSDVIINQTPDHSAVVISWQAPVPPSSRTEARDFLGYKVWRLYAGQEAYEGSWTLLTPNVITATSFTDNGWLGLTQHYGYKCAVRSIYSGNNFTAPVWSDSITAADNGNISGIVSAISRSPLAGVLIYANGFTTTTDVNGHYSLPVFALTVPYTIALSLPGYQTVVHTGVYVSPYQSINLNFQLFSNQPVMDSFEDYPLWSGNLYPWLTYDNDGLPTVTNDNISFPGEGQPHGFITVNPLSIINGYCTLGLPHSGYQMLACFSTAGSANNDWLISQLYDLPGEQRYITFWAKSALSASGQARFRVALSQSGTTTTDFSYLGGFYLAGGNWTYYSIPISNSQNAQFRVGINCNSTTGFALLIDDFNLLGTNTIPQTDTPLAQTCLLGCFPNPFYQSTTVSFEIKQPVQTSIEIYNTKGQRIRTLSEGLTKAGRYSVVWDARDNDGRQVSGGVYLCKMTAGQYKSTRKLIYVK